MNSLQGKKSLLATLRSNPSEVFLQKSVLKICSNMLCNIIEIALWHVCSPANLLHICRTPFPKDTSGGLFPRKEIVSYEFFKVLDL